MVGKSDSDSKTTMVPIENIIHVPINVLQVAGSTISALHHFQSGGHACGPAETFREINQINQSNMFNSDS